MSEIEWLEPWVPVAQFDMDDVDTYCAGWENQLRREVGPRHVLRGKSIKLIARRFDCDDALFRLADDQVADVHLTWARGEEPDPAWPATSIYPSLEVWARERMLADHEDRYPRP